MQKGLLIGLIAAYASGCSPYLHSPPARMVPLEAAKSLPKGDFAIQGALAGGVAVWGPSVGAGTAQGRYGFGRGFEGAAEVGFAALGARDTEWTTSASRSMFAARAGFKYEAASWFAVQAGFGGGVSAAGGFISPDAGVIFSYQGERVVPFFSGGFFYSLPLAEKDIVFRDGDRVEVLRADKTLGYQGNIGLRVPFTKSRSDSPRSAVMFGYRLVVAVHNEEYGRGPDMYNLFVFGLDLVFRKDKSPGNAGRRWKMH